VLTYLRCFSSLLLLHLVYQHHFTLLYSPSLAVATQSNEPKQPLCHCPANAACKQQSRQAPHAALPTRPPEARGRRRQAPFGWPIQLCKLSQTIYTSSVYTLTTANKELAKSKKTNIYTYIHKKSHDFLFHIDSKKVQLATSTKLALLLHHPTLSSESAFTAGSKAAGLHTGYSRLQLLSHYFGPSTQHYILYVALTSSLLLHSPVRIPHPQQQQVKKKTKTNKTSQTKFY